MVTIPYTTYAQRVLDLLTRKVMLRPSDLDVIGPHGLSCRA